MSKKNDKEEISNNKSSSVSSCTRTMYMLTMAFYIAELFLFYSAANSESEVEKNCKIQNAEEAFIFGTISLAGAFLNHLVDNDNRSFDESLKKVSECPVIGESNC